MKTINDIIDLIINLPCVMTFIKYTDKSPECYGDLDFGCAFCFTHDVIKICIENIDRY